MQKINTEKLEVAHQNTRFFLSLYIFCASLFFIEFLFPTVFLCITVSVSLYQASIPSPFWIELSAQKTTLWCLSLQGCAPERKSTCRFEDYFRIRICHRQ